MKMAPTVKKPRQKLDKSGMAASSGQPSGQDHTGELASQMSQVPKVPKPLEKEVIFRTPILLGNLNLPTQIAALNIRYRTSEALHST
jgi:hypothetical protein